MTSINPMVPPARRSARASTAHPPLFGVPTGKEWRQRHHQPRPSLLARFLTRIL